jgi:cytochrome c oxidase subunit II
MEFLIESASTYAKDIDGIIELIAWIVGPWFLLTFGIFIYFIFKFRKKEGVKALYIDGENPDHMKWISRPHAAVLLFDIVVVIVAIQVWNKVKIDLPEPDYTIGVVGHQWSWRFIHPGQDGKLGTADDIETVDELHVMVDKTYHFKLTSVDVLHSFSVPVFRLKQDAVPGREITGWFNATKTGEFDIQCAEMCGIGHGIMGGRIHIATEADHNKWIASRTGAH